MHLSHPPASSVNDGIPVAEFSLKYISVDTATDAIMELGQGCLLAKIDVKSAFRICPVRIEDQPLLGIQWQGAFYYDMVLPFGLRSAPYIFNCLAEALCWILQFNYDVSYIMHYLDMGNLHRLPYLLRGIKRLYSQERRVRLPITPSIFLSFRTLLNLQWHDHIMLWTAMLVAFFAFLRSAELIALTTSDLSMCTSSPLSSLPTYILSIRISKTDPFRQVCQVRLAPSGHPILCPAKILTDYLRIAHLSPCSSLFAWSSGNPLCRATLTNGIKWLAAATGINERLYSSHSFRIGAATTASAAGLPDSLIKTMGRWSSDAYQTYIRTPLPLLDSVASTMANYKL